VSASLHTFWKARSGHRFGTDTDPNFHVIADPDPDPYPHQNNADPQADFTPSFTRWEIRNFVDF
jgi:hypothetical protein